MKVTKQATYQFEAPPDVVFDVVTAEDVLPKVLHRYGPVPAVTGTTVLDGPEWNRSGCRREVHLGDGSMLYEQIDEFERPMRFTYDVSPQTGSTALLIQSARGEWTFELTNTGHTHVEWTYHFTPARAFFAPLVGVFAVFFHRYMRKALNRTAELVAQT